MNALNLNKIPIDLHCHSINSDGTHSVIELLDMAKQNFGKHLALTDHDTVEGIKEAKLYADKIGLNFIAGVEVSVTWDNNVLVHILGYGIDENNDELTYNLNLLRAERFKRGEKIANKLAEAGIHGALEGALKYCKNKNSLSRTHFAKFLVDNGYAKNSKVFDKYLANGKLAYVMQTWATLKDAISWINNSGGVAVIAHPCRYNLTKVELQRLITEFKMYGGIGIEVISSSHSKEESIEIASLANKNELYGSVGTDFHSISWYPNGGLVGTNYPLPNICKPIYPLLGINLI